MVQGNESNAGQGRRWPFGRGHGQGTKELVFSQERTDPRVILAQAGAFTLVALVVVLLVVMVAMCWIPRPWAWLAENWRYVATAELMVAIVGALAAAVMLFIEVFDPRYPATRGTIDTSRPVMPWTKELATYGQTNEKEDSSVDNYDLA